LNPSDTSLARLGWAQFFEDGLARLGVEDGRPGRLTASLGRLFQVSMAEGEIEAEVAGHLRHAARAAIDMPAVGDWVVLHPELTSIVGVIDRRSVLVRKVAGQVAEGQVLAANVDRVIVTASLSSQVRERGIERYLTMAWESGATPVVVMTKSDLVDNPDDALGAVRDVANGVDVLAVSNVTGEGLDAVREVLQPGLTAVVVGPSGAGKSSLINGLRNSAELATGEVRADQKGRHTTTHRQLYHLPGGAMIVDTPGIRELQLWHSDDGIAMAFSDVEELAARCRFTDCAHHAEPGCAVLAAMEAGQLSAGRLASYRKLRRELAALAIRTDARAEAQQRRGWKQLTKAMRAMPTKRG
jgi:ribosome biogenesis GTPase